MTVLVILFRDALMTTGDVDGAVILTKALVYRVAQTSTPNKQPLVFKTVDIARFFSQI